MRERKVGSRKRHNTVCVWVNGHRFPHSNEVRQHTSARSFFFNGWSTWLSELSYPGSTAWYEYKFIVITLSFSAFTWGIWEVTHR